MDPRKIRTQSYCFKAEKLVEPSLDELPEVSSRILLLINDLDLFVAEIGPERFRLRQHCLRSSKNKRREHQKTSNKNRAGKSRLFEQSFLLFFFWLSLRLSLQSAVRNTHYISASPRQETFGPGS